MTTQQEHLDALGNYDFGWHDSDAAGMSARRGIDDSVVRNISALKNEPEWMLENRLKGLNLLEKNTMPNWVSDLS